MADKHSTSEKAPNGVIENTNGTAAKRPPPAPSKNQGTVKKRPYRRTKRPKNYCDKSTVTTTTPTLANQPVNVYDAVLGECEDLLKAAAEAQQLGRLKMASAYQLLLHTRLVGLGKRFDRAEIAPPLDRSEEDEDEARGNESDNEYQPIPKARIGGLNMDGEPDSKPKAAPQRSSLAASAGIPVEPPKGKVVAVLPQALEKLTEILPSNLEMDVSMMEHLARAAVELHHQRTGKKMSSEGLLASPPSGLIGSPAPAHDGNAATNSGKDNAKIAWTEEEQEVVEQAVSEKKTPNAIAKLLRNKTEAQVKAFLKNQAKSEEQTEALADDLGSPSSKKRGGRGRKPPTTAMNTVPNANLDAKSLLKGILKRED